MTHFALRTGLVTFIAIAWTSVVNAGGGWYHMPTDFFQCMGWGFGPGYHADLVLQKGGIYPHTHNRIVRVPVAPFATGVGCYGCNTCGMSQLPGCEIAPLPYSEPTSADVTPSTTPQPVVLASATPAEQVTTPIATAPVRTLPPLFPPPPLVAPVR